MNYEGPALEIIVREPKSDNLSEIVEKTLSYVPKG